MSLLELKNVSYTYSSGTPFEITAIEDINLTIEKGSFVGIIGHTGSGKSTLIQHFNALLKPTTGQVLLNGKDINQSKQSAHEARFKVGLCFQYPEYQLFETTVYRDIAFGPTNMGLSEDEIKERVREAAELVGLTDELLKKSPFELSGGEKRRAAIAGIIAMRPEVLVLDEPTAGLDPSGRKKILGMISEFRKSTNSTVIIVSHSMEDVASLAEKIIVMNKGRIYKYADVHEIFTKSEELAALGLEVPPVTSIFLKLKEKGLDVNTDIYTKEQAEKELLRYLKREGIAW
ncbi:MAG: energy-coupling factor transporter ATPase [Clostridiales bacterium]|nr:energy-coupling factor transporter ATPase [Clostridiales bacterium]